MNNYKLFEDKIVFDCGCSFDRNKFGIVFDVDTHNPNNTLNIECPATYQLLSDGITEGIFQLTSQLGNSWCKKLIPTEIEHIIALGSLLRPGCLQAKDDKGNNITVRYERKKNKKMELSNYHPIVDKILEKSYGENLFQETSLDLAKQCAGFSLSEAEVLRKGIGKKIASIISDCKKKFIEKGIEFGVFTKEQLEEIFSWIEASQRYSFNRSLTYDSIVETKDGLKSLDEVKIGDFVKSPTDDFSNDNYTEIKNIYDHGNQDVFEITLESGKTIKCTLQHKFLCDDDIVRPLMDILIEHHSIKCEEE